MNIGDTVVMVNHQPFNCGQIVDIENHDSGTAYYQVFVDVGPTYQWHLRKHLLVVTDVDRMVAL